MGERTSSPDRRPWPGGHVVALVLGFLTVAGFYGSLALTFGPLEIPPDEWPTLLLHVLLAASPFGILSWAGIRGKLPWIVAVLLTVCFWGAFYVSVLVAEPDQGANIGMGWLMLLSPALIAGGAWLAAELMGARSRR